MLMKKVEKRLIVIAGPTAVGKTSYAIKLAQEYNTEIISTDSRQFYRELQIGTAAPTEEELNAAPHHFIGNLSIHNYYNVSIYEKEAIKKIEELFKTHDTVIAVGGSGLYIDALCYGIDNLPDAEPKLRQEIKDKFATYGIEYLQDEVRRLDPDYFAKADINNHKRLQRALEVCIQTGKTYSSQRTEKKIKRNFKIEKIVMNMPREILYDRINKRVDIMVEEGLIEEVKGLIPNKDLNALNTVGYKELFQYFDNNISLEQAITDIKTHSRRYAKRQLTWFKRYDDFTWIENNK
ncbi:MAG: tRNA (adenosine(37)-N6)-dimethylallyltransferase MiaA [Bacteroidetes bacterium]|nr:MAG: tRNA (adenosine(37)-N6)-dimethylallyltransferase MiaA [Bacteroidota bacterium]